MRLETRIQSLLFRFPFCSYCRRSSATASGSSTRLRSRMASSSRSKLAAAVGNIPKLPWEVDLVDGIANTCWVKFSKEATFALYTPFIVSLASGNLKVETFRQCVSQDVHFLKPFSQAFELAERYADDDDKHWINKLRKITIKKLNLHDYCVQEWGSDVVKDTTPNPATSKCKNFLLDTVLGRIDGIKPLARGFTPYEKTKLAAYIIGLITSCIRLNAYIGKEVRGVLCEHHPYKKWIENYSSDTFQDFCLQTEECLENLSVALTGEEIGIVERLYCQGIKHETEFLLAQPVIEKAVVPLSGEHNRVMIFSDFDLTCTFVDSCAILAELAIVTAPKSNQRRTARMILSDLRKKWKVISKKYTDGYEQCIEKLLSTEYAEKLNYEGLRKALEQLSDFEKEANLRVIKSGVLKGLKLENIRRAGELLKLQDGCMDFFKTIKKKKKNVNADVHVISYCWCGYLIRSAFLTGGLDDLKVHANDLEFDKSLSTGGIVKKVQSPIDKVEAFDKILLESSGKGNDDKKKVVSVYIGDAVGDLLCLLKADVGIVVGSSPSLRRVGKHFGVRFIPLFSGVVEKQRECVKEMEAGEDTWKGGLSGILYTASSWAEIHAFVFGS
ncbi:PREDICTED: probable aminopyrimidine aminohydrolase, mitochondrial [Ipomoea nil]|uniref:probable aminopyrimidine aminohydrolase, mitochondrial n=1 Tax=Ipomoea nil TaxID=35883 RepID=UPI000900DA92|nr:PREDICTED: probable aminopyrimidine aminohydrolase, mitochondrial [Ipomoea nil]